MYDKLINRLREQADAERFFGGEKMLYDEAADAIEELQAQLMFSNDAAKTIAEKVPKWIPVTERLPKKYESVWTCSKFGMLQDEYLGKYDGENYFARQTTHVTHWMPLPELPKEET